MRFKELLKNINQATDDLDFVTARKYIEENMELLKEKKHLLNQNARELLEFMVKRLEAGHQPLDKQELASVQAVNMYAEQFDVRGVKMIVKQKPNLFMKPEAAQNLTNDAKVVLVGMGVLKKEA
ncbi:hypothetical protein J416_11867 [Gracilibacillus halophilus YIM-C55.5]|uniref:Uncharacterized protein n=1 Tax=Gracilibacillus halophilus YIM-C55.5 TaxID=1308866 RepID=N4WAA0_9BACI|nr:hypothetical protein [Gracilibacillus halophilus]ENH96199.1 hypothetical protein J416_11867 [Gracilibacillus halophilus YIM-C55.5]